MSDELYSVWNASKKGGRGEWATTTNFSTPEEAEALRQVIIRQCQKDTYIVKVRPFGTVGVDQ